MLTLTARRHRVKSDTTCASTLPKYGDHIRVTSKVSDVVSDKLQRQMLVPHADISRGSAVPGIGKACVEDEPYINQ